MKTMIITLDYHCYVSTEIFYIQGRMMIKNLMLIMLVGVSVFGGVFTPDEYGVLEPKDFKYTVDSDNECVSMSDETTNILYGLYESGKIELTDVIFELEKDNIYFTVNTPDENDYDDQVFTNNPDTCMQLASYLADKSDYEK